MTSSSREEARAWISLVRLSFRRRVPVNSTNTAPTTPALRIYAHHHQEQPAKAEAVNVFIGVAIGIGITFIGAVVVSGVVAVVVVDVVFLAPTRLGS